VRPLPTAPVAAGTFLVSWAVVEASGSRLTGGAVLALGGLWCLREWDHRHDRRTALVLGATGLAAFALSHLLALAIGPWPAVAVAAALVGSAAWLRADAHDPATVGPAAR